jgi:polypyrimidine tract-binding protein 2
VYLDHIPSDWTEQTLRQVLMPIGDVLKIVLLRKRNALFAGFDSRTLEAARSSSMQALVEAADLDAAERIVRVLNETPVPTGDNNEVLAASYSKNQELRDRGVGGGGRQYRHAGDGARSNRILLITVQNPTYPITTDFIHDIFSTYGVVEKVVIFVKPIGLQVSRSTIAVCALCNVPTSLTCIVTWSAVLGAVRVPGGGD